jgi:hypothetical protein
MGTDGTRTSCNSSSTPRERATPAMGRLTTIIARRGVPRIWRAPRPHGIPASISTPRWRSPTSSGASRRSGRRCRPCPAWQRLPQRPLSCVHWLHAGPVRSRRGVALRGLPRQRGAAARAVSLRQPRECLSRNKQACTTSGSANVCCRGGRRQPQKSPRRASRAARRRAKAKGTR